MEAGRGLRDSLVKPPAQSRDSCSSGLDRGSCSKPLRGETAQLLWATSSTVWLPSWLKFPLTSCLNFCFGICPLPLVLLSCATTRSLVPSPWYPLHTHLKGCFSSLHSPSHPKPCLLPAKQAHSPSLALQGKCSIADCLGGPPLKSLHFINVFLILQGPELNTAYPMWYNSKGWFEQQPCSQQRKKKKTISNHCQYTFEKKESSKLTVITIGKFQVRAGNGDAHSIPGSFNGQVWKCKQVATHLCLKVKWAWTAKFSSRKHRVTYVYPEHLTSCEWMDSTFYYSFQWAASFLTRCLPGI